MALTLYWSVYPDATADYANNATDAAKVAAGQDSTGAALPAGSYGSQAYSAPGVIDASTAASGLTAGTAYRIAWTIGDAGVYGGGTSTYVVVSGVVTTAFVGSIVESASATDTAAASFVINASASIVESATGTDDASASYTASGAASIVESASATDTQTAAATVVASLLESASATDLVAATLVAAVAIVEAASGTDTTTGSFSAAGTVGVVETANATDTLSAAATLLAVIVEAGNATDAATAAATVVAMLTETAVATDSVSAGAPGTWNVSIVELAAAVDAVHAYLTGDAPRLSANPIGRVLSATRRPAAVSTTRRPASLSTRTR